MSFPAGIVRVFSGGMAPPVLSFRLLNTGAIEQFLPNAELLYRCGDAGTRWHRGTGWGWVGGAERAHGVPVGAVMGSWCWGAQGAGGGQQAPLEGGECGDGELVLGCGGCLVPWEVLGAPSSRWVQQWGAGVGARGVLRPGSRGCWVSGCPCPRGEEAVASPCFSPPSPPSPQRPVAERPQHQGLLAEHGRADGAPAEAGGAEPGRVLLQRGSAQVPGEPGAGRPRGSSTPTAGSRHPS